MWIKSHCVHCDENRIIFLIIFWGPKIAGKYGINEKYGKELENNYCLHKSYVTTYARKSHDFNVTSFSKCKGKFTLECLKWHYSVQLIVLWRVLIAGCLVAGGGGNLMFFIGSEWVKGESEHPQRTVPKLEETDSVSYRSMNRSQNYSTEWKK